MPVETVIDETENLVTHTVSGSFRMVDIEPVWTAMLADPRFRAGMNVLWDFRQTTHAIEFSASNIQQVVDMTNSHIKQRGAQYKLALLASQDLFFGLSKMFEAYSDEIPINTRVFRSMEKALVWLN